jgi:hypothetical protein
VPVWLREGLTKISFGENGLGVFKNLVLDRGLEAVVWDGNEKTFPTLSQRTRKGRGNLMRDGNELIAKGWARGLAYPFPF